LFFWHRHGGGGFPFGICVVWLQVYLCRPVFVKILRGNFFGFVVTDFVLEFKGWVRFCGAQSVPDNFLDHSARGHMGTRHFSNINTPLKS